MAGENYGALFCWPYCIDVSHCGSGPHTIKVCVWSSAWINTRSRRESEFLWAREKTMRESICFVYPFHSLCASHLRPPAASSKHCSGDRSTTAPSVATPAESATKAPRRSLCTLYGLLKYLLLKSPSRRVYFCLNASGIISGQFITAHTLVFDLRTSVLQLIYLPEGFFPLIPAAVTLLLSHD